VAARRDDAEPGEVFEVPDALAGERVDRAVAMLTGWSRAEVQTLIERGSVSVGGRRVAKSHRLEVGEVVEVAEEPAGGAPPGPEPVPIDVVYEDADVVVIAKPAGLVVHPGAGHPHGTLVHGLLHRYPEIAEVGERARPGIVHRLDRDTSGLLVVARSPRAYDALVAALAARDLDRRYLALVWGAPDASRGLIDAPIGRSTTRRTRMAVRGEGRPARTEFEVIERFAEPVCALIECHLETGRTHQIRVHLSAIGHPIVGDATYGGVRESLDPGRTFLHAAVLAFAHPVTGTALHFEQPLPPDLAAVLDRLRESRR
jgi:23S rRNA pseudouridine1911/1915/1917 synthase